MTMYLLKDKAEGKNVTFYVEKHEFSYVVYDFYFFLGHAFYCTTIWTLKMKQGIEAMIKHMV